MWEDSVTAKSWGMASFAEAWFADALREATERTGTRCDAPQDPDLHAATDGVTILHKPQGG